MAESVDPTESVVAVEVANQFVDSLITATDQVLPTEPELAIVAPKIDIRAPSPPPIEVVREEPKPEEPNPEVAQTKIGEPLKETPIISRQEPEKMLRNGTLIVERDIGDDIEATEVQLEEPVLEKEGTVAERPRQLHVEGETSESELDEEVKEDRRNK